MTVLECAREVRDQCTHGTRENVPMRGLPILGGQLEVVRPAARPESMPRLASWGSLLWNQSLLEGWPVPQGHDASSISRRQISGLPPPPARQSALSTTSSDLKHLLRWLCDISLNRRSSLANQLRNPWTRQSPVRRLHTWGQGNRNRPGFRTPAPMLVPLHQAVGLAASRRSRADCGGKVRTARLAQ